MTRKKIFYYFLVLFYCLSCTNDDENSQVTNETSTQLKERIISLFGSLEALQLPNSEAYEAIPSDIKNAITADKVALGKFLFHETELGINPRIATGSKTYSCASCHHSKAGFQSGIKQGIGEGGLGFGTVGETRTANPNYIMDSIDVQPIRSPSILNVAYQDVMLWNGQFGATGTNSGTEANWTAGTPIATNNLGFQGVETQAIAGMKVHRLNIDMLPEFIENSAYKSLFDQAFPEVPIDLRYNLEHAGLAIAAFERTVLANQAPFQEFLGGEANALSEAELEGALLFFGKANCYACHAGPALNSMDFFALGMNDLSGTDIIGTVDDATAKGRGGFTKNPDDNYKFKTPTLYNLKDVSFLGHGGSFTSVKDILTYKNNAIAENTNVPETQLSNLFVPLNLSDEELNLLTLFIENGLYDSNLDRYTPAFTPLGSTCFPNADLQSKLDLDCE